MHTRTQLLKLTIVGAVLVAGVVYCLTGHQVAAFSTGPPIGRTGAPALGAFPSELTCQGCHSSFAVNSGPGTLTIAGLPATYATGQEYTITVTINQADRMRYGFEATALDDLGRRIGDLILTETDRTRLVDGTGNYVGRQYVQHILAGVTPNGTNQNSWTFRWKAPALSAGRVTFYVASNAANGNLNNQGDHIYIANASTLPGSSLPQVASVSAASYNGTLASESISSIFGMNLAAGNASATAQPLPTDLGGAKVKVKDNLGVERDAGLFAVSKGQINYLVPPSTALGVATVTVFKDNAAIASGNVPIETIAPGVFSANMNGAGPASAVVMRLKANGDQTFESTIRFDTAQNRFLTNPIDFGADQGAASDQLFLVLFGSGFRGRSALSTVTCSIGGTSSEVLFAGPVMGFAGLDQANIRLPRSLAGRNADVTITLTVGPRAANNVTMNIR